MQCPKCGADDYYMGIMSFSTPKCSNPNCPNPPSGKEWKQKELEIEILNYCGKCENGTAIMNNDKSAFICTKCGNSEEIKIEQKCDNCATICNGVEGCSPWTCYFCSHINYITSENIKNCQISKKIKQKEFDFTEHETMHEPHQKIKDSVSVITVMCAECQHKQRVTFDSNMWKCEKCGELWIKTVFIQKEVPEIKIDTSKTSNKIEWMQPGPMFGYVCGKTESGICYTFFV
jgi:ribosomal protein L37AE/L43A